MSKISEAWQVIRRHPWKIFLGSTGTLIFTVGGFFFTDARYAHRVYVDQQFKEQQVRIEELENKLKELSEK